MALWAGRVGQRGESGLEVAEPVVQGSGDSVCRGLGGGLGPGRFGVGDTGEQQCGGLQAGDDQGEDDAKEAEPDGPAACGGLGRRRGGGLDEFMVACADPASRRPGLEGVDWGLLSNRAASGFTGRAGRG